MMDELLAPAAHPTHTTVLADGPARSTRVARAAWLLLLLPVALAGAGCGGGSDAAPTTPTTFVTDTFTGSLTQGSTETHRFTVMAAGQVDVTLTSVTPLATLAVGVAVGTWNGTTCTRLGSNENARQSSTVIALTGNATVGQYCLQIYDVGNVTEGTTVSYSAQIRHP